MPDDLADEEVGSSVLHLAAQGLLRRVRSSCDGPLLLLKGLEIAAHYPEPSLRPFLDVDVLVPDAERTQRQLVAAGFREVGDPQTCADIQHLRPLRWPAIPIHVEIHRRPKWPRGIEAPPTSELFSAASASATGVDGLLALPPAHHAVVVGAHGWAHVPLARLRDIVDVAALITAADREEAERIAEAWALERIWRATTSVMDALLFGGDPPLPLHVWARHLPRVRDRSLVEHHMRRLLSPFWTFPPRTAAVRMARALVTKSRPARHAPAR